MPRLADPNLQGVPETEETARVWRLFTKQRPGDRFTAKEVQEATGVKLRTASARCVQLAELNLLKAGRAIATGRKYEFNKALVKNNPAVAKALDELLTEYP